MNEISDSKIKLKKNKQIFSMQVDANFLKFKKSKNPLCKKWVPVIRFA
jgi:hypothetical protein